MEKMTPSTLSFRIVLNLAWDFSILKRYDECCSPYSNHLLLDLIKAPSALHLKISFSLFWCKA